MRYIVFAVILLGLTACGETEIEKNNREGLERMQRLRERNRQFSEELWRQQQARERQQWGQPQPQPQQVLVTCPECRGSGRASRSPEADAWTENRCQYCQGHGTVVAGQGRRSAF